MYERYTDERLLGHHSLPELSMPQGVGNTICMLCRRGSNYCSSVDVHRGQVTRQNLELTLLACSGREPEEIRFVETRK